MFFSSLYFLLPLPEHVSFLHSVWVITFDCNIPVNLTDSSVRMHQGGLVIQFALCGSRPVISNGVNCRSGIAFRVGRCVRKLASLHGLELLQFLFCVISIVLFCWVFFVLATLHDCEMMSFTTRLFLWKSIEDWTRKLLKTDWTSFFCRLMLSNWSLSGTLLLHLQDLQLQRKMYRGSYYNNCFSQLVTSFF